MIFKLISLLVFLQCSLALENDEHLIKWHMPGVKTIVHDTYLCIAFKIPKVEYITAFRPQGNMTTAHHMILYGCKDPGFPENTPWNCGEMAIDGVMDKHYKTGPPCKDGSGIIYAWAMEAPPLTLPSDVAFKIGPGTSNPWVVLNLHFKVVQKAPNHAGIDVVVTEKPKPKLASVYMMGTAGTVPKHAVTYMETACTYDDKVVLHPFAFRTHAHAHGIMNVGYRIRDGKWTEIGRQSPKEPQMFYNVTHPGMLIKPHDTLAARCIMDNEDDKDVQIGATAADEMCNFYIMYWVQGQKFPKQNSCWSGGFPEFSWVSYFDGFDGMDVPPMTSFINPVDQKLWKDAHKEYEETMKEAKEEMNEAGKEMKSAGEEVEHAMDDLDSDFDFREENELPEEAFDERESFLPNEDLDF